MPFAFIDVETTGVDVRSDRIIQISVQLEGGSGATFLVNPHRPIPPEVIELTGLDPATIAMAPDWKQVAPTVLEMIVGRSLVGYNIAKFDLPIIRTELNRGGFPPDSIPLETPVIDLLQWRRHYSPQTLETAVAEFTELDTEAIDWHDARADTQVLEPLMNGMREHFAPGQRVLDINKIVTADFATPCGSLRYDEAGEVIFNFGKHKGKRVRDQHSYANWYIGSGDNPHVVAVLQRVTEGLKQNQWRKRRNPTRSR